MPRIKTHKIVKGNYLVCRFKGESGDVIAGKVLKLSRGKVHVKNLLTGTVSVRSTDIVNRRNVIVPRKQVTAIRDCYNEMFANPRKKRSAKRVARTMAVKAAKLTREKT